MDGDSRPWLRSGLPRILPPAEFLVISEDEGEEEEALEYEEDEEEEEEEEDEGEEEDGEDDNGGPVDMEIDMDNRTLGDTSVRVLESHVTTTSSVELENGSNQDIQKKSSKSDSKEEKVETNDESDGWSCPICMDTWSSMGDHQICCLPCGHIYGLSCIKKWLLQRRSQGKCPQCNSKCTLKDVRVLYASRIVAADGELQEKVRTLEAKCVSLENKDVDWRKKENQWRKREDELFMLVQRLKKRTRDLEDVLDGVNQRPLTLFSSAQNGSVIPSGKRSSGADTYQHEYQNGFTILNDWELDGARLFDVDVFGQTIVVARRLSGVRALQALAKISLLAPNATETIQLQPCIKAVRDLRVSPHARLALLASLGNRLTVLSTESNNTVLTYDLPTAAWSCAWDVCNPNYLYAGLQNGMVLEFDIRQTMRPVESRSGLASNPVHTVHSLLPDSSLGNGARSILTASSVGLCHWNFDRSDERVSLIPESGNQGICISAAYGSSGEIVASFRPKIGTTGDTALSQPSSTPRASTLAHGAQGPIVSAVSQPSSTPPPSTLPTSTLCHGAPGAHVLAHSQPASTPSTSTLGHGAQGAHVSYTRVGSMYQKISSTAATVSNIRLPKTAVIDRANQKSLFAAEDEVTGDLGLQELPSFMGFQQLKCKKSPIYDVKYFKVRSSELLGCLSVDSLRLFTPTSH